MNNEHQMLSKQKCVPCEGGTEPLTPSDIVAFKKHTPLWEDRASKEISRDFELTTFADAIRFINQVAELAEAEGHHPNLYLHDWNKLTISLSTHAIGGLSQNDFILAAKIDELLHHS